MSLVDQTLNQRFYIVKPLGQGGFGHTYQAEDRKFNTRPLCVVKHLQLDQSNLREIDRLPEPQRTETINRIKQLFRQEAEVLSRLSTYNDRIPKLIDRFDEGNELFLVQEFIDGAPLSDELQARSKFSQAETIELLIQILTPLEYCHAENLIHRDLKPANIMRRKNGDLVLIDFGLVKDMGAASITKKSYGGTPGYAPLEQIMHGLPEPASDVYAVGVIAIQALTGLDTSELLDPDTLEGKWRNHCDVTDDFATVLNCMVEIFAKRRYQNAAEAIATVNALTSTTPPQQNLSQLVESYITSGNAKFSEKKYQEAIADYDKAIELDAMYARAYQDRADAKRWLGRFSEAMADYDKAIELDHTCAIAYNGRAFVKRCVGEQYKEIIADYDRAIELEPVNACLYRDRADARANHDRSNVKIHVRRCLEAITDYDKAIELDPTDSSLYASRGNTKIEVELYQEAINDYDKGIELQPTSYLYKKRGDAKSTLKQYQEAINDYNEASKFSQHDSSSIKQSIRIAELNIEGNIRREKILEEIATYDKLIELNPKNVTYYRARAGLKFNRLSQANDEIIADYNRAIELDTGDALTYFHRGSVKLRLKRYKESIKDFDRAIKLKPLHSEFYRQRSDAKKGSCFYDQKEVDGDVKKADILADKSFYSSIFTWYLLVKSLFNMG
jgi:serine/threonine protein kinase